MVIIMKIKKHGWINIHKWPTESERSTGGIFESKKEAIETADDTIMDCPRVATIQIEWEEDV